MYVCVCVCLCVCVCVSVCLRVCVYVCAIYTRWQRDGLRSPLLFDSHLLKW